MREALRTQPIPLLVVVCGTATALAAACLALGGGRVDGLWIAAALASVSILDHLAKRSFLRHGRESQTITCDEIAIVAAALVATPAAIVLAVILSTVAGSLVTRRPLKKAVWNTGSYALEAMLAMLVFHALGGHLGEANARSVLAALAAGVVFVVTNSILFAVLLSKLGAGRVPRVLYETVRNDRAHMAGVLSIGVLGAVAMPLSLWTIVPVLVAVVALEHGLGGYVSARTDRDKLESLLAASSDGIFAVDGGGRVSRWNPAMAALFASPAEAAVGAHLRDAAPALTPEQVDLLLDGSTETVELVVPDALGGRRSLRVARAPLPGQGTLLTVSDSTAIVSSLEVLRAHRDRLGLALESSGSALWEWDAGEGRFTWSENLDMPVASARSFASGLGIAGGDAQAVTDANEAALASGEPYEIEVQALGPDGAHRWLRLRANVVRQGGKTLLRGIAQDISEVRRREAEQKRLAAATRIATSQAVDAEQRLQRMLSQMNDGFYAVDRDWRFVFVNDRGAELLGSSPVALIGQQAGGFEDFSDGALAAAARQAMEGRTVARVESELIEPGRWFEVTVHPVPEGIWLFSRETTDERLLEEQLRHAQKMDAVGRLAGGIAHDFNNLLTVINGYSSLALVRAQEVDAALARRVEQVLAAGQRAATLTTQLLAFSRQQVLRTRVVDLNATVLEVDAMLRRLLGPKVALETKLDPGLTTVKADPGGLEQVLMNLCVNARDAIGGAGTITVETGHRIFDPGDVLPDPDLQPGDYVLVSVTDTGAGIPDDVLPRIFEPFFTTKPAGSGTGLGLATAYGIVKQSGGALTASSVVGAGSTFTVYLPRTTEARTAEVETGEPVPGGGESILLVEDEAIVRRLTRDLLTSFGYVVTEVTSAEEALALDESFDLVVSDVVMPGMSGVELAQHLSATRPGVRILLVSGHSTDDIRALDGNRRWRYLPKPFTPQDLAWTVRSLLDAPGEGESGRFLAQTVV
jgi:PAS domain S-box-containing protein